MKINSQKDLWTGLLFVVAGLGFAMGSTRYGLGDSAKPGPGFFPLGLGLLLAVIGAALLLKTFMVRTADGEPIGAFAWRPLLFILGAATLFGMLLPRLGLVITLPILVFVASMAGGRLKWKPALASAVVLTIVVWLIFIQGLALSLPVWPTGIF